MHGFASAACAQGYWPRGLTSPHTRLATEHGKSSAGGDSSVAQPEGTAPHVRMQSIAQTRTPITRQLSHSTKLVTIAATSAAVAMAAQFGSRLTNTWRKQTVAARNSTNHQTDAHHIEKLSLHLVASSSPWQFTLSPLQSRVTSLSKPSHGGRVTCTPVAGVREASAVALRVGCCHPAVSQPTAAGEHRIGRVSRYHDVPSKFQVHTAC